MVYAERCLPECEATLFDAPYNIINAAVYRAHISLKAKTGGNYFGNIVQVF